MNLTEENNSKKKVILTKKYTINDFPVLYINLERELAKNVAYLIQLQVFKMELI